MLKKQLLTTLKKRTSLKTHLYENILKKANIYKDSKIFNIKYSTSLDFEAIIFNISEGSKKNNNSLSRKVYY